MSPLRANAATFVPKDPADSGNTARIEPTVNRKKKHRGRNRNGGSGAKSEQYRADNSKAKESASTRSSRKSDRSNHRRGRKLGKLVDRMERQSTDTKPKKQDAALSEEISSLNIANFPALADPVSTNATKWSVLNTFSAAPLSLNDSCTIKDKIFDESLTVLRPGKPSRRVKSGPLLSVDSRDERVGAQILPTEAQSERLNLHHQPNAKTFSRLRNRWWNAVREHHINELEKKEREALSEQKQISQQNYKTRTFELDDVECNDPNLFLTVLPVEPLHVETNMLALKDPDETSLNSETEKPSTLVLHNCVRKNDSKSLGLFLRCEHLELVSTLRLSIELDRPELVRLICSSSNSILDGSVPTTTEHHPFLLAAELDRDECLQALLSHISTASFLTLRDHQGNAAFHLCCQTPVDTSTVSSSTNAFNALLAHSISSSKGGGASILFKALSNKNNQQQTPLHVACQCCRSDIIDIVLNHRSISSISMLPKLLAMLDIQQQSPLISAVSAGSTDIVMSLLMWRGNNHCAKQLPTQHQTYTISKAKLPYMRQKQSDTSQSSPCPLVWAVKAKNVDMVILLLEFNDDSSESGYDLNKALQHAILVGSKLPIADNDMHGEVLEIVRVLVEAGANPSIRIPKSTWHAADGYTTYTLASLYHNSRYLEVLLSSHQTYLDRSNRRRRLDTTLQKQPTSFFESLESAENVLRNLAVRDALVTTLYFCSKKTTSDSSERNNYIACALVLYRSGVGLLATDVDRLRSSLKERELKMFVEDKECLQRNALPHCQYKSRRISSGFTTIGGDEPIEDSVMQWSQTMQTLPWFANATGCKCRKISEKISPRKNLKQNLPSVDVVLVCSDGTRFQAHQTILSKSSKIAAAIRFTSMSRHCDIVESTSLEEMPEVPVTLSEETCRWLLEHLYHGSVVTPLPKDAARCCQVLLDLLIVAEEFLCPSLMQECEIRLLAACTHYNACLCNNCHSMVATTEPLCQLGKSLFERYFQVDGPSFLITSDTALDVLAVSQYIDDFCGDLNYEIRAIQSNAPKVSNKMNPLGSVITFTMETILRDFHKVANSNTFSSHFEQDDRWSSESILLQMCVGTLFLDTVADAYIP